MKSHKIDVIIIGAGASGMMAAGIAAREGKRVLLLEKNKVVGKKLSITGGGRCNITNAQYDTRLLLENYGEAKKFLFSSFDQFDSKDSFIFFEEKKLPLYTEDRFRTFPKSQKATDVTNTMNEFITHPNIILQRDAVVVKINTIKNKISSIHTKIGSDEVMYTAKHFIFATGGASHPETGSTGDGFTWLSNLGHNVAMPTPGLVPWKVTNSWIREMSGASIEDVVINIHSHESKKKIRGRVLCTHFGLSGPTIISSSHILRDALHDGDVKVYIDMLPKMDYGTLNAHLLGIFAEHSNKQFKNVLKEIITYALPESFIDCLPNINADTRLREITREQRNEIVKILKAVPIHVTGFKGYGKSIVADGGVALEEINWKTMRSLKIINLSVTGDLLNIRRPSGGYSLQLCWTTGYVAGKNA